MLEDKYIIIRQHGGPTEFTELPIGNDERAESSETVQRLVTMLLSSLLVDRSAWESSIANIDLLRLPDEVLEEIALILCKGEIFCLHNNFAEVSDQFLTLKRKLLGRVG